MATPAPQVKHPSVSLFGFHLSHDLSQGFGDFRSDADQLWEQVANLSQPLQSPQLAQLPIKVQTALRKHENLEKHLIPILGIDPTGKDNIFAIPCHIDNCTIELKVRPFQINDSYVIDLTLESTKAVISATDFFKVCNPEGRLLAGQFKASLGQTIVLYAEPCDDQQSDQELAEICVNAFLLESRLNRPSMQPLNGRLFGSPIFEYDNLEDSPEQQCHLWVWINRSSETLNRINENYYSLLQLLLVRSKILYAYNASTQVYRQARVSHQQLEQEVQEFQKLSKEAYPNCLDDFKAKLSDIPVKTFNYSHGLRYMQDHLITINTNRRNFNHWLQILTGYSIPGDNLDFLQAFSSQRSQTFSDQIETYLNFLAPGGELYNQMLEAIRGMVEIEQAERDCRLQRTVQVIGTGIGVGGVVASSSPTALLGKPLPIPFINYTLPNTVHPFVFSISLTLVSAVLAGITASFLTRLR